MTTQTPPVAPAPSPTSTEKQRGPVRTGPKWEADVRDRLRGAIRKFSKPANDLIASDANEGNTRILVTSFLSEGLGYDPFKELTMEYLVKGEFADYGVRLDNEIVAFIEVKRIKTKLSPKHLQQVKTYAVNEGVEWLVLTNGSHWQVYHLAFTQPVETDLVLDIDLLGEQSPTHKVDQFFHLSREALKRRTIEDVWKAKSATSPKALAQIVTSPAIIESIRKELRQRTKYNADAPEIERLLRSTVIRQDCFDK